MLTESFDTNKIVKKICTSKAYHKMDYFLTLPATRKGTLALCIAMAAYFISFNGGGFGTGDKTSCNSVCHGVIAA
jgi:hypothetical protein